MTKNVTLMDEAVRHAKTKGLKKEIVYQINHVRLHKKVCLPVELKRASRKYRTVSFDTKNSKSQFKLKFSFPMLEQLRPKSMKTWDQFKSG